MTTPVVTAAGATASVLTGTTTPAWPAHSVNDIALLMVLSGGNTPPSLSTPAGFSLLVSSQPNNGANLFVYWCRATTTSMASPTTSNIGRTVVSKIITLSGCVTSGNPWEVTAANSSSGSSYSIAAASPTASNNLIIGILAAAEAATANPISTGPTNANLSGIVLDANECHVSGTTQLGLGFVEGGKATPGSYGNTTGTLSGNYAQATVSMSFPDVFPITRTPSTGSLTLTGGTPVQGSKTFTSTGSLVLSGNAPLILTVPSTGSLVLTGAAPVLTSQVVIPPGTGVLVLASAPQTLTRQDTLTMQTGVLAFIADPPQVIIPGRITPSRGQMDVFGNVPTATRQDTLNTVAGALILAGIAGTRSLGATASPGAGALGIAGKAAGLVVIYTAMRLFRLALRGVAFILGGRLPVFRI